MHLSFFKLYLFYLNTFVTCAGLTISSGLARPSSTPAEYYEDFEEDEDFDDVWWEVNPKFTLQNMNEHICN